MKLRSRILRASVVAALLAAQCDVAVGAYSIAMNNPNAPLNPPSGAEITYGGTANWQGTSSPPSDNPIVYVEVDLVWTYYTPFTDSRNTTGNSAYSITDSEYANVINRDTKAGVLDWTSAAQPPPATMPKVPLTATKYGSNGTYYWIQAFPQKSHYVPCRDAAGTEIYAVQDIGSIN